MQKTIKLLFVLIVSTLLNASTNWAPVVMGDIMTFVPYNSKPTITTAASQYAPNETVAITINGELSGDRDWAGIYPVGASNDWSNVIAWNWVGNGTTQLTLNQKPMPAGAYEIRLFFYNSFEVKATYSFSVSGNPSKINTISAQNTASALTLTMDGKFEKGSHGSFFIDADNNQDTGYSVDTVKGADYLVQGTALYEYTGDGDNWDWHKISTTGATIQTPTSISSAIPLNRIETGDTIRYIAAISNPDWTHRKNYMQMIAYKMSGDNSSNVIIGARPVAATPLEKGKLFASPHGDGNSCSKNNPCSIYMAITKLSADNNVLFLRSGVYHTNAVVAISEYKNGTANKPLIIESYPQEMAILTGDATVDKIKNGEVKPYDGFWIGGGQGLRYIKLRNLEIKNMGGRGVVIMRTKGITIEGCHIHDNHLSGIHLYQSSHNIIVDNHLYNNSDIGLFGKIEYSDYDGGGNADGVNIDYTAQSKNNNISHNTVYNNSDDGIDLIGGIDTVANYNLVYQNKGIAGEDSVNAGPGNGIGIKGCGGNARGTHLEHNIAFGNNGNGFECNANSGEGVVFQCNTSYKNKNYGFEISTGDSVAKLLKNISTQNQNSENNTHGIQSNNSWDRDGQVRFMSTDPHSANFLKPVKGSGFEDIGAYANIGDNKNKQAKLFVIGDSTTFNHDVSDAQGNLLEMGWAEREALGRYMKNANNLYDEGRSGASSKSYKTVLDSSHDWEETKRLIAETDISQGAYLLIQFGHNDEHKDKDGTTTDQFYDELAVYVNWAKEHSLKPILITPVERRKKLKGSDNVKTHEKAGGYAQVVRNLAKDKGITLLDLQDKSWREYNTYDDTAAINAILAYDDNTHFSPTGAYKVAGWVKELICQSNAQDLCAQFK